jgi:hypothetical protein
VKPLVEIEHWFQSEIVRPHEGRSKPEIEREQSAEPYVKPSSRLSAAERVEIYSDMYFARLCEVLGEEYAVVRALAGHEDFSRLVRAYLREYPSRHWSLAELGRQLPEFLNGKFRLPKKALLSDVARLECLMAIVFDAPRSNVLTPDDVARVDPRSFDTARLVCVPALRIASFDHAANAIVRAVRHDEKPKSLAKQRTFTVVWRKDWVVWRMDLGEAMFHVLFAIQSGRTIGEAIAAGGAHHHGDAASLQAAVSRSFGEWIGEGIFERVETR